MTMGNDVYYITISVLLLLPVALSFTILIQKITLAFVEAILFFQFYLSGTLYHQKVIHSVGWEWNTW